jgi:hypothetical protein
MNIYSRLIRRAMLALVIPVAALVVPSAALAVEHHPTGLFAPFADCPLSDPAVELCMVADSTSGEVAIRSTVVPITKTIILQGGAYENTTTHELEFVGAEDGNTLSKTPQTVPGGLLGIIAPESLPLGLGQTINKLVSEGLAGVNATTELVATPTLNENKLVEGLGTALILPVRIHLENAFLGGSCYIGSKSDPVTLQLTDGTTSPPPPNMPIAGKLGEIEFEEEGALLIIKGNSLVDNSFAVPTAQGCGGLLSLLIDPAIDLKLGLPSPAGHNTAILNNTIEQAAAAAVKASE